MYINELNIRNGPYKYNLHDMKYIFASTKMDGLRFLGKTSRKMNDYDFSTPTTTEIPEYECCEMIAAFVCLGCIMTVILAIALVWFIRRKRKTKQYTLHKQMPKISGSQTERYASSV